MRLIFILFIICLSYNISAQLKEKPIKLIPEISMKTGSQQPTVGGQFALVAGFMLHEYLFVGFGAAYATNMGMGGATFPLYADGRFYFHPKNAFLFKSKDAKNDFQVDTQIGFDINPDDVWKTGFIAGIGFAYRFDFIKIQEFNIPAFYLGFNIEYNHSNYYDEYRGFVIKDGYLTHTMFNIKIAFDIQPFKIL